MSKFMKSEFTTRLNNSKGLRESGIEFVGSAKKIARAMATNYNQKKKAYEASQTSFHQHGSLDISRIHSYRTSDDIFKKSTITKDGASHGLVCSLDFSISMKGILNSVAMQFLITSLFCKYIKIDFQFFSWTSDYIDNNTPRNKYRPFMQGGRRGQEFARFVDIGNNSMSEAELVETFYHILSLRQIQSGDGNYSREYTRYIASTLGEMNSTPLLAALYQSYLLAHGMKERGIQNVNILTINDGDNNCHFAIDGSLGTDNITSIEAPYSRRVYHIEDKDKGNNALISCINKMTRDDGIKSYNMFLSDDMNSRYSDGVTGKIKGYLNYHDGEAPRISPQDSVKFKDTMQETGIIEIKNLCFYDTVMFVNANIFPKLGRNDNKVVDPSNASKFIETRSAEIKQLSALGRVLSDLMVADFKISKSK